MNVKIDTKEKFSVITPVEPRIPANLTEEMANILLPYLKKEVPHLVLNLEAVQEMNEIVANKIADIQQEFYEKNASFVVCSLQEPVEAQFEKLELLEIMNITPTESEAWDIVQMEEIERELLGDFDEETT